MGRYRKIPEAVFTDPRQERRGFDMEAFAVADSAKLAADYEQAYQETAERSFDKVGKRETGYAVPVGQPITSVEVTLTLIPQEPSSSTAVEPQAKFPSAA